MWRCGEGKRRPVWPNRTEVKQADNLSLEVRGHWDEAGSLAEVIRPKAWLSHPERGDTGTCDDKQESYSHGSLLPSAHRVLESGFV